MRVLVDTNIFISYLLTNDQDKTITRIIEAGFENKYTLLSPHEVLDEFSQKLTEKKISCKPHIKRRRERIYRTA